MNLSPVNAEESFVGPSKKFKLEPASAPLIFTVSPSRVTVTPPTPVRSALEMVDEPVTVTLDPPPPAASPIRSTPVPLTDGR